MIEGFGARLRHERERRQIALQTIAETTKISITLLEGLERDNVSRWPTGIFRKSYIRDYAKAIGLDPDIVAREFAELYPDPTEVVPVAPEAVAAKPAAAAAAALEPARNTISRVSEAVGRASSRVNAVPKALRRMPPVVIRFTIVSTGPTFTKGRFLNDVRKRWAAAACDAGVSFLMALCLFAVLGRFWTPLGVSMLCYYVGGIVILGNTPGVCLFAPDQTEAPPRAAHQQIEL